MLITHTLSLSLSLPREATKFELFRAGLLSRSPDAGASETLALSHTGVLGIPLE